MITIRNMRELRELADGVAKRAMEKQAILCHDDDDEILEQMEEEFNGCLGGDWYMFEEGDDLHNFVLYEGYHTDLLSEEWNWCDVATLEDGCFFVFWGTNNAGGPCLFVADVPGIPTELRLRLDALVEAASRYS